MQYRGEKIPQFATTHPSTEHHPEPNQLSSEQTSNHPCYRFPKPLKKSVPCRFTPLSVAPRKTNLWNEFVARYHHLGWTSQQREKNLPFVIDNPKFLILPWTDIQSRITHYLGGLSTVAQRVDPTIQLHYPCLSKPSFKFIHIQYRHRIPCF